MADSRVRTAAGELQAILFALMGVVNRDTGNVSLTEIFSGLQTPGFPFSPTFFAFIKFKNPISEAFETHLQIDDPNGNVIWSPPDAVLNIKLDPPSFSMLAGVQATFKAAGPYILRVSIDGVEVGSEGFTVLEVKTAVAK